MLQTPLICTYLHLSTYGHIRGGDILGWTNVICTLIRHFLYKKTIAIYIQQWKDLIGRLQHHCGIQQNNLLLNMKQNCLRNGKGRSGSNHSFAISKYETLHLHSVKNKHINDCSINSSKWWFELFFFFLISIDVRTECSCSWRMLRRKWMCDNRNTWV